jgi:sugar O-acyltransferase (sialic acid O-acetyltransferase NeuD family)
VKLLILGAGGHGRAVAEAALLTRRWSEIFFADDSWSEGIVTSSLGFSILCNINGIINFCEQFDEAVVAVGNNTLRENWVMKLQEMDIPLATVIHPAAVVSPSAVIGKGVTVMALAAIGALAEIGHAAIINAGAIVDHDCVIGDFSHLGVGVKLAGGVKVGSRVWLKVGSCAGYNVNILDDVVSSVGEIFD